MHIQVSKYSGVTCQRATLSAGAVGDSVGDITGVLQYSFNQWTIQVRQTADLPGVVCAMDAGVGPG
jgi:predicted extracellular nuclease